MKAQFRIVDLLWLILVCFFAVAWWVEHRRFVELQEALKPAEETEMKMGGGSYAGASGMSAMGGYPGTPGGMPGMMGGMGMSGGSMSSAGMYGGEMGGDEYGSGYGANGSSGGYDASSFVDTAKAADDPAVAPIGGLPGSPGRPGEPAADGSAGKEGAGGSDAGVSNSPFGGGPAPDAE